MSERGLIETSRSGRIIQPWTPPARRPGKAIRAEIPMASDFPPARVGAVSYLNSKPLIEGLSERVPLSLDYPSCLAADLAAEQLDVALVPSIEYFRHPEYRIVSDACVATHGDVMSVKLYCRVHPGEIRRLALDEGSRTSSTLVQIMLAEKYGVRPQIEPLPMAHDTTQSDADAILLIGDRAMKSPAEHFIETWDLGREWKQWTGLPFVFAMWVARGDADTTHLAAELCAARDRGVASLERIAHREAQALGISEERAFEYLRYNLHFHLGSAEYSGLRLFSQFALQLGLIPEDQNLVQDYATA